jgi:hypothetical protein
MHIHSVKSLKHIGYPIWICFGECLYASRANLTINGDISVNSVKWFVFVLEMQYIFREVWTQLLNNRIIYMNFSFQNDFREELLFVLSIQCVK